MHDVGSFEYFCGKRWGIEVLDEKTADAFLNKISKYSVSADELHSLLSENGGSEQDMEPSFYVDLDNRKFYSFFPEAASYEDFVPNGWEGKYCCFKSLIPKSEAYWDNTPDRK
ncbi:MAG: hypothetical protein ACI4K7_00490 [Oscillospiraceae bacterium]